MEYPIPDYGDVFTLEEFKHMCEDRSVTDDDGTGYYALPPDYYRGFVAKPSDFKRGDIQENFTHVVWFNK